MSSNIDTPFQRKALIEMSLACLTQFRYGTIEFVVNPISGNKYTDYLLEILKWTPDKGKLDNSDLVNIRHYAQELFNERMIHLIHSEYSLQMLFDMEAVITEVEGSLVSESYCFILSKL